jgi:hypothetical protein
MQSAQVFLKERKLLTPLPLQYNHFFVIRQVYRNLRPAILVLEKSDKIPLPSQAALRYAWHETWRGFLFFARGEDSGDIPDG